MKQYSHLITVIGGILAFFCFALPWEKAYSGIYLANGTGSLITILLMVSLAIICTNIFLISTKSNVNSWIITAALLLGMLGVYSCIVVFTRHDDSSINFASIAFIASLVIIGATIYMLNRIHVKPTDSVGTLPTLWVLTSSCVGLCCFLVLFFGDSLDLELNDVSINTTRYGASLTAVGFILAIVGTLCFPIHENSFEPKDKKEKGDEE